jgi:dihydrofolate reductase
MTVSLVAAMARNRVIGRGNALPWHLPADLRRFKALTTGHAVVMGRKTFDAIGRPLPGRQNIVITRQPSFSPGGVEVARSLPDALARARGEEVFVIGGGEIFEQALPLADRVYLTVVDDEIEGDVWFPELDDEAWRVTHDEPHPADERHAQAYRFLVCERAAVPAREER